MRINLSILMSYNSIIENYCFLESKILIEAQVSYTIKIRYISSKKIIHK